MDSTQLTEALSWCAEFAAKDHPNNPELRSMKFIALLAGRITPANRSLADLLFALTEPDTQQFAKKKNPT